MVRAVRDGLASLEEVLDWYHMSADEFHAWERDIDRHGVPGLRSTRVQIYRTTENSGATTTQTYRVRRERR